MMAKPRNPRVFDVPVVLTAPVARAISMQITAAEMQATGTLPNKPAAGNAGDELTAVEQLEAAVDMLNRSHGDLSYGLRSPEDAIRLWRAWVNHPLDIYPDEWEVQEFLDVLGYDPFAENDKSSLRVKTPTKTKRSKTKV